MLKKFRRRVGVSAPRLSIRPEIPLIWRAVLVLVLSAIALALAAWIYDAGRQFAGFDRSESGEQLEHLHKQVAELSAELSDVRRVADASEARLQVESTSQERLAALIGNLEEENARLKAELAVFESIAGNDNAIPKLDISRFNIAREAGTNTYTYKMLITKTGRGLDKGFKGRIEFLVSVQRQATIDMMTLSGIKIGADDILSFKLFRRIEGRFAIPDGSVIKSVEARLLEDGQVRASQLVTLPSKP
jgi:hypothetical protein